MQSARDQVRVARALQDLPLLSEAMRRGAISYCKVRAVTRIATTDSEEALLHLAETRTVTQLEKIVLEQADPRHKSRYLQAYTAENGCVVVKGVFSPEQGALFLKALQGACDALREAEGASHEAIEAPDSADDRRGARNADALECTRTSFLAHGHAPLATRERHVVHVHVDEAVLRDPEAHGRCEIEGSAARPATLQRLCCDARLVTVVEDALGNPKALSRKTRVVPTPLFRALMLRDGGCRFPGCCNTRFVDAHHIQLWTNGGPTTLENLLLLCSRHHKFVHEYGYRVVMHEGEPRFLQPDGREVTTIAPTPVDAELGWQRLVAAQAELGNDAHTSGRMHYACGSPPPG